MTTTASKQALLMREIAGPEKMPWVRMAYTLVAPADISLRERNRINALCRSPHDWIYPGTEVSKRYSVMISLNFDIRTIVTSNSVPVVKSFGML